MTSTDIVTQDQALASSTLFGTDNPAEVVQRAAVVATALADLVRRQNLIVRIGQSDHVRVEGWTLLGSMLGVFPVVTWTRPVVVLRPDEPAQNLGWEARVEARTRAGEVVGAAESECLRTERTWASRDDYALRSMAQTRAVSKALRLPLGFVMQLAGFNPTPAEEMGVELPTVDMSDPDIPFGDAPDPKATPKPATAAQLKKLNVLVGKMRPDLVSTLELYERLRRKPIPSDDGVLHWSPLRDSLTRSEAHELIDWLEDFTGLSGEPQADHSGQQAAAAASVSQPSEDEAASPDEILVVSARLIGASSRPQEAAYAIEMHAGKHSPGEHLGWLRRQERTRFGGDAA